MNTYIDFCLQCGNETDLMQGVCVDCAEINYFNNTEATVTFN